MGREGKPRFPAVFQGVMCVSVIQVLATAVDYLRIISPADVVDIAILAYLIYRGIGVLQRTGASNVVKALMIIVALVWLSYQFHLNAINFVLSKAVELGLLALVILFQPEIRRFLDQIGSNSTFRLFREDAPASELERAIEETVAACGEMSRNRVGALIVFERTTNLSHVISSGTAFQSTVSGELLKNIFYPKAPLHDGAVVIRKGRIAAAACMLPMSDSTNLSKELGMRHRAALGMSERSDAVIAVVSEETGAISVMMQGNLRRHLAPDTLGRVLRNELLTSENRSADLTAKLKKRTLWFWKGGGDRREDQ